MKTPVKFALAVAVLIVGAFLFTLLSPKPSDEVLIQQALDESIQAAKEGRPGSVLDLLSRKFTVNGADGVSTGQIAKFIRESKPGVVVKNATPTIHGDSAEIKSAVELEVGIPFNTKVTIPDVSMKFAREDSTQWLIIPVKKWKLREVEVPPDSIPGSLGGFTGF